jgi:hypothetical protein
MVQPAFLLVHVTNIKRVLSSCEVFEIITMERENAIVARINDRVINNFEYNCELVLRVLHVIGALLRE